MGWRIGADIGGTFTDVVVINDGNGQVGIAKTSTTPRAFAEGVVRALSNAIDEHAVVREEVHLLSHATTVVTNAVLESTGARVALITTRGFRDILELRRSTRADLYDIAQDAPSVLVPRRRRLEVSERIDANGDVVVPLAVEEIDALIERLRAWQVEAVAVSLLFSFLNDDHERVLGEHLRRALPQVPVFLSSEVLPEIREFERSSTTAVCAYVAPILESYLRELDATVRRMGLPSPYVMGSSGGLLEIPEALQVPAMVVESGPAAGVIASAQVGAQIHRPHLISFDMGGTTAKASLILDGEITTTPEYEVGGNASRARYVHGTGHPIRIPVVDLAEVSAGGGSIAWVDPAGALRVGPQSAGAEPGPVCYGRGGEQPTVTDANLLLGRLDANSLLGGALPVNFERARDAIDEHIAKPLGISVEQAAASIVDIVNNAMAEALRTVSVERGHDPREFTLMAFGGAGPLHAIALAEELEMSDIVIPPVPGAFSALGLVATNVKRDYARTWYYTLDAADANALTEQFADMEATAQAMLERAGFAASTRIVTRSVDVRYLRQAYELNVEVASGVLDASALDAIAQAFNDKHLATYGHCNREERIQMVTLRVHAEGQLAKIPLRHSHLEGESLKAHREVWFKHCERVTVPVYDRARLEVGRHIAGPAVIESLDSTLVLTPQWSLQVGDGGFLFLAPNSPDRESS